MPSAPWTCRIGLHTGVVVVGSQQDDAALSTIVGDVVSVARVLQEQAAPGQIHVVPTQRGWSRGRAT